MPVRMSSGEATSTAWSIPVSAPSSFTNAQANGRSKGWPSRTTDCHAQLVTSPAVPTSTSSVRASAVCGSYSTGGHMTPPSLMRTPTTTPSRRPVKKADWTGPTVRVKGYSTTSGALRTLLSLIAAKPRTRSSFRPNDAPLHRISTSPAGLPDTGSVLSAP
jgi:hypothetical protein